MTTLRDALVDEVLAIRAAARAGVRHRRLAERFGVSEATISDIVRRRYWRHLPEEAA